MISKKNKENLSKAMALGMAITSVAPVVIQKNHVEAEKVTSSSTKYVKVTCSALNVRRGASTSYSVIGTAIEGATLKYISTYKNGWYKVIYKNQTGYVSNKYSKITTSSTTTNKTSTTNDSIRKVGKVTVSSLNVRTGPGTNYGVKKTLSRGSVVGIITSSSNGWSKVKLSNSSTGYIYTQYLSIRSGDSSDIKINASSNSSSSTSSSSKTTNKKISIVLSTLKAQVGKPYVYGAAGPNCFDCSGLTYYCYKKAGIYLNRNSRAQASNGRYVSKSNLKPGDLIFFNSGTNTIRHVGMYVGNGKFIHAPSPGKSVKYENLYSSYYIKGYVTARRIID